MRSVGHGLLVGLLVPLSCLLAAAHGNDAVRMLTTIRDPSAVTALLLCVFSLIAVDASVTAFVLIKIEEQGQNPAAENARRI